LAQGQTQGSSLIAHQQTLTTGPFGNTCEVDEVSPEVAIGGVAGHRCLQPEGVQDDSRTTTQGSLEILNPIMLNSVKLVIFIIFSRENNNIIII
jgi:hypothetical protein